MPSRTGIRGTVGPAGFGLGWGVSFVQAEWVGRHVLTVAQVMGTSCWNSAVSRKGFRESRWREIGKSWFQAVLG